METPYSYEEQEPLGFCERVLAALCCFSSREAPEPNTAQLRCHSESVSPSASLLSECADSTGFLETYQAPNYNRESRPTVGFPQDSGASTSTSSGRGATDSDRVRLLQKLPPQQPLARVRGERSGASSCGGHHRTGSEPVTSRPCQQSSNEDEPSTSSSQTFHRRTVSGEQVSTSSAESCALLSSDHVEDVGQDDKDEFTTATGSPSKDAAALCWSYHNHTHSFSGSVEEENVCPTCLEEYTEENPAIVTKCGHSFHLGCIYEWMERSNRCPVCSKVMVFTEGTL
mmetsp:Transcript_14309/g.17327  ORF Transcript_14309/g.17327 Transcript_14309/m.17327 type:complete len:285 (-) Transcript_14309:600-1454(-)|eukprot:CAMPEP_0197846872 /NCGR_PEP_ID=MMETSP1438-20131217/4689_1 /TAXON_ID=1461541 /ORGANISM="Pterosperma sp., Strain CCMP1384" /LENGTH=284 /DNA_ID=CAMNT_0043458651 /DNA_START=93 /DNA_END=947 /DNA_ORIENTATION=-